MLVHISRRAIGSRLFTETIRCIPSRSTQSLQPRADANNCCVFSTLQIALCYWPGMVEWPIFAAHVLAVAASNCFLAAPNCVQPCAVNLLTDVPQRYGDTSMKRKSLLLAILAPALVSAGCCCCPWLRRPAPVAACPPPCPPPACNPCATAPVTYGAPVAPVAPYAPPPQW
jgi:hypothetical protein